MQAFRQLRHPDVSYIFQTDTSNLGWGINCTTNPNLQSQGLWRNDQCTLHINYNFELSRKNLQQASRGSFSSPCMAHTDMVPHSTPDVSSTTQVVDLGTTGEAFESSIGQPPQHGKQIKADGLSCVRQHYKSQGLSKNVTSVLLYS